MNVKTPGYQDRYVITTNPESGEDQLYDLEEQCFMSIGEVETLLNAYAHSLIWLAAHNKPAAQ